MTMTALERRKYSITSYKFKIRVALRLKATARSLCDRLVILICRVSRLSLTWINITFTCIYGRTFYDDVCADVSRHIPFNMA